MQTIQLEHPDYLARRLMWQRYRDLYVGGEQIKNNAPQYLSRRQSEPADVYGERLAAVFYENYIGSIVDWYAATLFRREPVFHVEGNSQAGRKFFNEFTHDCDMKGSTITGFLRKQLVNTLVYGTSYTLLDFPRVASPLVNRAEEEASGAARAYLVEFTPENLINWSTDERGNYEWVVLRTAHLRNADTQRLSWKEETRWTYYDRQNYREYRESSGDAKQVHIVAEGRHGLAGQNKVPLFEMRASEGLWLLNKAGLLQLEHFNKSNALSWALTMGLFATPVVYSERPWNQIVSESYYIQLGPNDRFGWTEPEGRVFQIAAQNLSRLQEEIYRVCYLLTQAGGASGATAQSGLSKLRDFAITQEVLRGYGDMVKDSLNRILAAVEAARGDGLLIGASGLDEFDVGDFGADLQDAQSLLSFGIESPTLKKQIFKRLAAKYLCDVRQETKDRISQEIDDSFEQTEQ
ncbi:MAG TPA: hypothetical protein VMZ52_03470 [Bryobacteraceae bacterium]|nr:hypothetical protein [Bryobacteraceae bacterium]